MEREILFTGIGGQGVQLAAQVLARAAIAEGRLQALLAPFAVTTPGVFLYYPGRRQILPKLRAFIDHVKYKGTDGMRDRVRKRHDAESA